VKCDPKPPRPVARFTALKRWKHVRFPSLPSRSDLPLIVLGGASEFLYVHALSIEGAGASKIGWFIRLALTEGVIYFAACWIAWRARPSRSTLLIVVAFAALFRISILFAPPLLSDDVYRYVWDGRVQAAGINPYQYIPADPKLEGLRDQAIYPKINRRDFAPTMYPPGAEAIFFLTTRISQSVTWMKATMVGFEAVTVWALMALLASYGMSRHRVLIYAWQPLVVWEFAGSGHLDAIALAFVALALLARRRRLDSATGLLLAGATLIKFFPAILFPALYRRWGWKMPVVFLATTLLAYIPYTGVGVRGVLGYLPGYMGEEGMINGDRYFILSLARRLLGGIAVPQITYFAFGLSVLLGISFWFLSKQIQSESTFVARALALAAVFTVLLSPRYPWYFAWLVPFLCFLPAVSLFYLTVASFTLYGLWLNGGPGSLFAVDSVLYLPAALAVLLRLGWRAWAHWGRTDHLQPPPGTPVLSETGSQTLSLLPKVSVVIPCLNEEDTIAEVIRAVPRQTASEVIVVDNDSHDRTAERALSAGAQLIHEPRRGYGSACYAGFRACAKDCDIVVFMDGDGSERAELMSRLVEPIINGTHDFVLGSRLRGRRERGSMYLPQVAAGHLIGLILRILYGVRYTDMGPFRAIRRTALEQLDMNEMTYGWPLEMQMKAARAQLRILEVPVEYRRRNAGRSKISGTLTGTLRATIRILLTLVRVALEPSPSPSKTPSDMPSRPRRPF